MAEFSGPIFIFSFIIIVSFLLLYNIARQRTKTYKSGKRKFSALSNNLLQLKEHLLAESDKWPIYARPVMFTDIDHDAQIEFAKAQQALTDADQIVPRIERLEEPETPEQFKFEYVFNLPKNLRTISAGNRLAGNVSTLEEKITNIKNSVKSLRADRHQVENKRWEVERSIVELSHRTEQTNSNLKPAAVWKSIESHSFSWVVNIADRCQLEAHTRVNKISDSEQGYLEHAIADAFVKIGNFSLDCIDLFLESQTISRRYELDVFSVLFIESTVFLQSILAMEEDWSGWRRLQRAQVHIDEFPATRLLAERSLRIFKYQQQCLEGLIAQINEINLSAQIEKVDGLEKECTHYWFSYEERKTCWEKALGTPPRFPATELNRFQTLLVGKILPLIEIDMFIKQSQMMELIRRISQALEWYDFINNNIYQLTAELDSHKQAQKFVNALLDSQGKATIMLAELKLTLDDTSPDFGDLGQILVNEHQSYVERAKRVRGANFPELKNSLVEFIVESGTLVDHHNLELTKLMVEHKTLSGKIEILLREIDLYINHAPHFDNQTVKIFTINYKKGWGMLQERAVEKYSWLRAVTNKMRTWLQNAEPFTNQAREKHRVFVAVKKQVQDHLQKTTEELQTQRIFTEKKWGWLRNEITPHINRAEQSLTLEVNEWTRLEERNWAELAINKAIARCENLVKSTEEILDALNQQIGKINQRQKTLSDKSNDIVRLTQNNLHKLSQQDRDEIRSLTNFAMRAENYDMADKILEYARTLAMRKASSQIRSEIKRIINIYSDGGPVFMDRVSNTGSIRGRADKRIVYRTKRE